MFFGGLRLLRPVEEGDDLAADAVVIGAEFVGDGALGDAFFHGTEDGLGIVGVGTHVFYLALRAKQREVEQNGVLVHLRPCFAIAGRATNPQGVLICFSHVIRLLIQVIIHYT